MENNLIYSPNIQKAIQFAIKTHEIYQKQTRKGKDIPYITHPLTVGLILARAGASEDIIIAGLLHDTVEDSHKDHKVTPAMLDERFGLAVGALVASVTEPNKDLPWKERKQEALEHIKTMDVSSLLVKSDDVISNVSEILADYKSEGEAVFERFNAPKADLIANYRAVAKALLNGLSEFNSPFNDDLRAIDDELKQMAIEPVNAKEDNYIYFKKPTQCFLWKKDKLTSEDLHYQNLEVVETFVDDDHFSRRLIKCQECGQLYFKEFYETTDYIGGNDPQYVTLVPVDTKEDIEKLKATSMFELAKFYPRILSNFPSYLDKPEVCWVGR